MDSVKQNIFIFDVEGLGYPNFAEQIILPLITSGKKFFSGHMHIERGQELLSQAGLSDYLDLCFGIDNAEILLALGADISDMGSDLDNAFEQIVTKLGLGVPTELFDYNKELAWQTAMKEAMVNWLQN